MGAWFTALLTAELGGEVVSRLVGRHHGGAEGEEAAPAGAGAAVL
jgi:hypothetical protein